MFIFKKSSLTTLLSCIILLQVSLQAQLVSIHIGIDITEQSITDKLKALQKKIKIAANKQGYVFETDLGHAFHITLAKIPTQDEDDIMTCHDCINELSMATNQFDLTEQLEKGKFNIFPRRKDAWGIWELPTKTNDQLTNLANTIEKCLLNAGLQPTTYDGFHPHISLGKLKPSIQSVPSWIPHLSIKNLKNHPFIVKKLRVSINTKENNLALQYTREFPLKKHKPKAAPVVPLEQDFGATLLMKTIENGLLEKASFLISTGQDINAQDNQGWNALMFASMYGNTDIVKQLLAAGAKVNNQTYQWHTTALMLATLYGNRRLLKSGNVDIVRQLIAAKANVNLPDVSGHTALAMAIEANNVDIVKLLIPAGADPFLKNPIDDKTPYDLATPEMKLIIRALLKNKQTKAQEKVQLVAKAASVQQTVSEKKEAPSSCATM